MTEDMEILVSSANMLTAVFKFGRLRAQAKRALLLASAILLTGIFWLNSYKTSFDIKALDFQSGEVPITYLLLNESDLDDMLRTETTTKPSKKNWLLSKQNKPGIYKQTLDVASIQKERLETVKKTCRKMRNKSEAWGPGMSGTAFVSEDPALVYCFVPKAGCTYWKQVFRFLTGDYDKEHLNISSPEEIPRLHAHFGPWRLTRRLGLRNELVMKELNSKGFRFMFARDPYARFWSGYLDKFFLPDFWNLYGRKIIKTVRSNATETSLKCGHDISFAEFLKYIVFEISNGHGVDMHFSRVYTRCDPCQMQFDAIGKVETFTDDVNFILDATNVNHSTWHTNRQTADHSLDEIFMLIQYNFDGQKRWEKADNKDCFSQLEIAKRLWKTFQCNGHIGLEHKFPKGEINKIKHDKNQVRDRLKNMTAQIRANVSKSESEDWKRQRVKCLHDAYKQVPPFVKDEIQRLYQYDFELFGYDSAPEYLYSI